MEKDFETFQRGYRSDMMNLRRILEETTYSVVAETVTSHQQLSVITASSTDKKLTEQRNTATKKHSVQVKEKHSQPSFSVASRSLPGNPFVKVAFVLRSDAT